ncbi:deaminase [Roseomonas sp. E05]|uniref:nucleoside deaminase n=1 Tax=Roseomonas sp. E05 TaxID=3046310 RepID=UPI0024BB4C37|nr:deaminase [Roseomonas sp. E05]MDJ0386486.1 deaminase [Roseomonas sp. E05]
MAQTQPLATPDASLLRRAFALASAARRRGDRPFGAVVAAPEGAVLAEAGSTQGASGGGTLAHSEMNALAALQAAGVPRAQLAAATIYSSGEPCAMCAAAIFYSGIGRVVYGLSGAAILHLRNARPETAGLSLSCRAVLESAAAPPCVIGPCLEEEGAEPHLGYWEAGPA